LGILGSLSQNNNEWREPTEVQGEVRDNIREGQSAMTRVYNRKHIPGVSLDLGEIVVMLKAPAAGQPTKLQSKYREKPLQVNQKLPGDTYRVAEVVPKGQTTYTTQHTYRNLNRGRFSIKKIIRMRTKTKGLLPAMIERERSQKLTTGRRCILHRTL